MTNKYILGDLDNIMFTKIRNLHLIMKLFNVLKNVNEKQTIISSTRMLVLHVAT